MSYETVITSLKMLMRRELLEIDTREHSRMIQGESDRASLILNGAMIERFVLYFVNAKMPSLNGDERNAIFKFDGPCGSFSSRIKMAQALGVIDRPTRKRLDLVRELRNVAAHAHHLVGFGTPEIRAAVIALLEARHRTLGERMCPGRLRAVYEFTCTELCLIIGGEYRRDHITRYFEAQAAQVAQAGAQPWPEKLPKRSPTSRPALARKDKPPRRPH